VIHATDNAIPFYERNRFVRVGAIARHEKQKKKKKKKKNEKKKNVDVPYVPPSSSVRNGGQEKKRRRGRPRKYPPNTPPYPSHPPKKVKVVVRSRYSANVGVHVCEPDQTPADVAELHHVDVRITHSFPLKLSTHTHTHTHSDM
jgi:hypothetical protein